MIATEQQSHEVRPPAPTPAVGATNAALRTMSKPAYADDGADATPTSQLANASSSNSTDTAPEHAPGLSDLPASVDSDTLDLTSVTRNFTTQSTSAPWQSVTLHNQPQLRLRPYPVPPSILIPPPHAQFAAPERALGSRDDLALKLSPVLGLGTSTRLSASLLTLPPASSLSSVTVDVDGAALMSSESPPSSATSENERKQTAEDAMSCQSGLTPSPPPLPTDAWPFETSIGGSVFTMLLHSPHFVDVSFQQPSQMTGAGASQSSSSLLLPPSQQHMNAMAPFPTEAHVGFGLQASPLGARMQSAQSLLYPQLSPMSALPAAATASSAVAGHTPSSAPSFASTLDLPVSMLNLSDVLLFGQDTAGLFLPPASSPTNVLKHVAPLAGPSPSPSPPQPPSLHAPGGVNVKDITLNVLRPHFNKPMAVVAKELGVCITLMKKICRRNGLVRWPHRRIRSLVNRIASLQVLAAGASDTEQPRLESQIATLRDELSAVIQNPNEKSRKAQADAKGRSPVSLPTTVSVEATGTRRSSGDGTATESDGNAHDGVMESRRSAGSGLAPPSHCTETQVASGVALHKHRSEAREKTEHQHQPTGAQSVAATSATQASNSIVVKLEPSLKKRKRGLERAQFGLAPPPIKIPCYRDVRMRRNSAPEQQHLRALLDATMRVLERPSTTTSAHRKRGSISSILCDPAE